VQVVAVNREEGVVGVKLFYVMTVSAEKGKTMGSFVFAKFMMLFIVL
jgi:hypothetical protein